MIITGNNIDYGGKGRKISPKVKRLYKPRSVMDLQGYEQGQEGLLAAIMWTSGKQKPIESTKQRTPISEAYSEERNQHLIIIQHATRAGMSGKAIHLISGCQQ